MTKTRLQTIHHIGKKVTGHRGYGV